jgi:hypothetical protein
MAAVDLGGREDGGLEHGGDVENRMKMLKAQIDTRAQGGRGEGGTRAANWTCPKSHITPNLRSLLILFGTIRYPFNSIGTG